MLDNIRSVHSRAASSDSDDNAYAEASAASTKSCGVRVSSSAIVDVLPRQRRDYSVLPRAAFAASCAMICTAVALGVGACSFLSGDPELLDEFAQNQVLGSACSGFGDGDDALATAF
ncbi:MAG: hypothetical protein GY822_15235 [Deltaproteobacteria bacterium]|nr:hypothetical protein [Deltaproteobacteria bacterium]